MPVWSPFWTKHAKQLPCAFKIKYPECLAYAEAKMWQLLDSRRTIPSTCRLSWRVRPNTFSSTGSPRPKPHQILMQRRCSPRTPAAQSEKLILLIKLVLSTTRTTRKCTMPQKDWKKQRISKNKKRRKLNRENKIRLPRLMLRKLTRKNIKSQERKKPKQQKNKWRLPRSISKLRIRWSKCVLHLRSHICMLMAYSTIRMEARPSQKLLIQLVGPTFTPSSMLSIETSILSLLTKLFTDDIYLRIEEL